MSNYEVKRMIPGDQYGDFDLGLPNKVPSLSGQPQTAAAKTQETRAMSEIQSAILMAKHDPRNENQCYMAIMAACKRPSLAETAMYCFPRGGTLVKGASIRLAEVCARSWGNIRVGITITTQTDDRTEARAYAFDMQTNYMVDQEFSVPHKRTTKKGVTRLTDERDIRELVQNIGSRYLRGCILRVIPADIIEAAIEQVQKTLESSDVPMGEQIRKMVMAFDELGVKVEHLEKRLGHNLDATIPQEIVTLKGIYKSIKDGMASREDFFDAFAPKQADAKAALMDMVAKNKKEVDKKPAEVDKETGEILPDDLK